MTALSSSKSLASLANHTTTGKPASSTTIDRTKRRRYLRKYINWLWPYRFSLAGVFTLALITAALDMVWPLAIRQIINGVLMRHDIAKATLNHRLDLLGGVVLGLLLTKQAIDTFRSYRTQVLNAKVIFRLRGTLYERMLSLPLGELGELKTGGIVSRLSSDVDAISGLVQQAVISPGVALLRVVLTVSILLWLSWRLAIGALILIPPIALMSFLWVRRVRPLYRSAQQARTEVDARVSETFGGIRIVRTFRREPRERRAYAVSHHTIIRKNLTAQRLELALAAAWGVLIPLSSLLCVWYGGRLVLRGLVGVGDIFAFQIYTVLLLQPVWMMVSSISSTQKSLAAMERVFDVLAMDTDKPDRPNAIDAPTMVQRVQFNGTTFEYRTGLPVLKNINLDIPGGSVVALVGPSGAGKTTLTDLIARFHDPSHGSIKLNGIDLRDLKLASFRSRLAVVQQETFLFDGTVAENIAYGRRGASEAHIIDAARRANAHEFIVQLPDRYATLIGERGLKLSGGQRQRLSIARAILADPAILILDEATSALDTESEQLIQASLAELFKHRTTFVIAHRLSTITHADRIVVLDQGQIIETGTHDELMTAGRMYYEMVRRQREAFGAEWRAMNAE